MRLIDGGGGDNLLKKEISLFSKENIHTRTSLQ
jgi:hypothetical protein